jgi:hypothetical protein
MRIERSAVRGRLLAGVALALGLVATGCGGKGVGEVTGTVTHKGQPVTAGAVKFVPEGGGDPVETPLGPDGTYRATGVPVGRSRVAVETLKFKAMTPPPAGLAKQMGGPRPVYVPIPEKYEKPDTSELSVEVKDGRVVTYNIELP